MGRDNPVGMIGQSLCELNPAAVGQIIDETSTAVSDSRKSIAESFKDYPTSEIGEAMLTAWRHWLASA